MTLVDPEKKTAAPNERQQTVLIFGLFQRLIEVPKIIAAVIEDRSEVNALSKDFVLSPNELCVASGDWRSPCSLSCEFECGDISDLLLGVEDPVQVYL